MVCAKGFGLDRMDRLLDDGNHHHGHAVWHVGVLVCCADARVLLVETREGWLDASNTCLQSAHEGLGRGLKHMPPTSTCA